ncbi:MAG TPA: hypothetical protein VNM38_08140 [Solirubrobacterales bacterium]|nr:hypothetical protein [Solirubrobacterales bacterium]
MLLAVLLSGLFGGQVGVAQAASAWSLAVHHAPTNFPPGGTGEYWFDVENTGGEDSVGSTVVRIHLPNDLSRISAGSPADATVPWTCPGTTGDTEIVCTTSSSIARHSISRSLIVVVQVAADTGGTGLLEATVEGGGAAGMAAGVEPTQISAAPAGFGILPESFSLDFLRSDGISRIREAGAHPGLVVMPLDLKTIETAVAGGTSRTRPAAALRDLDVDLPPGFLGYPAAVGECTPAQLISSACPPASQVGRVDGHLAFFGTADEPFRSFTLPLFNMSAPRGALADLVFESMNNPVHLKAFLDPSRNYALTIRSSNVNETVPATDLRITLWGVPADPVHDSERCGNFAFGSTAGECSAGVPPQPFLTLPSTCGQEEAVTLRNYDSWEEPGIFGPPLSALAADSLTGCGERQLEPDLEVEADTLRTATPSGVEVRVEVPPNEDPFGHATPPARSIAVRLPVGMGISPAAAPRLATCAPSQMQLRTDHPVSCPEASRIGAVSVVSPLLPQPLEGAIFLARQGDNPFGSLFGVYLVVHDSEERGVLVKIPGRLDLDRDDGRITALFEDLPQIPFESLRLAFAGGPRALLVSSSSCGTQAAEAAVSSYAQPDAVARSIDTYTLEEGSNGSPCPAASADRPFGPRMQAGTVDVRAGAYTQLALRFEREDREQELQTIRLDLPPGITADLTGVAICPDARIGSIASGTAAAELATPACPPDSRLGTATATAGAGAEPISLPGRVYLAGPYRGAPFSLETVVPLKVGPFDLGSIGLRSAVHIDPRTARASVVSDPLPTVIEGVPLSLRALRLTLGRPRFIRNPTDCEETAMKGAFASAEGTKAEVSDRFQVGGCGRLGFKPSIAVRFLGHPRRGAHPRIRTVLRSRWGDANLRRVALTLPPTMLLDSRGILDVCTRERFRWRDCPVGSAVGHLSVRTPLLDRPLRGAVYLLEGTGRLPALGAALDGDVDLEITGRVDSFRGRLRTIFSRLPDAPWSKIVFELDGGKGGLLVNTGGVCAAANRVPATILAHSGRVRRRALRAVSEC